MRVGRIVWQKEEVSAHKCAVSLLRIEEEKVEVQPDGEQRDDGPDDAENPNVDGFVGEVQLLSQPCEEMHAGEEEFVG